MIDRSRAWIPRRGFLFQPFSVRGEGTLLSAAGLADTTELLVFRLGGQVRALVAREMAYHHVAQGTVAGEPFLVTF
jgi:hypothetical protein